ncbi:hypothetical protein TrVGV298_001849 [Trichoderma virens]|nr:hypothetical protein TrVGV298_001849 [Trichoderma virens]
MSDNIPTDLASSIISGTTNVEEDAQQRAMWALPDDDSNDGNQEPRPLHQQDEEGELQNLRQYLSSCHHMNQAAQSLTAVAVCSQATALEPDGKLYPEQIAPSPDFMDKQLEVWNLVLADDNSALLQMLFPSMEKVHDEYFSMEPINGELTLCIFERLGVSKAVMNLLHGVLDDEALSKAVGLSGNITYGPLETPDDSSFEDNAPPGFEAHRSFCVYSNTEGGRSFPIVGIEYRPSDLPKVEEITAALAESIFPERDVIEREGDTVTLVSGSKQMVTATITRLFDCMVKSGVSYGYVYTGEAIIFLEIQDDPSIVTYHVSIPGNDVSNEDESTLHYSAVGQIFAFIIRAMQAGPRSAEWHDRAASLDVWRSSYSEALLDIPGSSRATSCGDEAMDDVDAEYEDVAEDAQGYNPDNDNQGHGNHGHDHQWLESQYVFVDKKDANDPYLNIAENMSLAFNIELKFCEDGTCVPEQEEDQQYARQLGEEGFIDDGEHAFWMQSDGVIVSDIRQRRYCTQECLLGLTNAEPLDPDCPNVDKHGSAHIDNMEFLSIVQDLLSGTRQVSGCCISLGLKGSLGTMFKVMIPSHGYTFVAKGVPEKNLPRLLREADTYTRLKDLQGGCVPVYLGIIQLEETFEHKNSALSHFMLLSWAGRSLETWNRSSESYGFANSTRRAYMELHSAGLLHNDAEPRNMLYNPQLDRIMLVDFERASIYECHVAEFEYRDITKGKYPATIEEVEDEDDLAGSGSGNNMSGDGQNHIHEHIPGHGHGGGLRRVNRCENLRKEFEAASKRELNHAVDVVKVLSQTLRSRDVKWEF